MADYLGLIFPMMQGCLQDVHWSAGLFGYFPSYTFGTLMAELYHVLETTIGNLDDVIHLVTFHQSPYGLINIFILWLQKNHR